MSMLRKNIMRKNNPLVSVLMPAYNTERFISEAIDSILNQTYQNFEFLILDDASTDNTWKIIQKYAEKDLRVKAYQNEVNLNIVKSRNKLFTLADLKAKYYAIFDSDDVSLENRLEQEVEFLEENPEYGIVGGHNLIINEKSEVIAKRKYETDYKKIRKNILIQSPLSQPSVMIRKSSIEKVGIYNEAFQYCEDYDLWIRILTHFKIINIDKFLLKYRISIEQSKNLHLHRILINTIKIQLYNIFKFFSLKSILFIVLEMVLLLLPKDSILKMFKKTYYSSNV